MSGITVFSIKEMLCPSNDSQLNKTKLPNGHISPSFCAIGAAKVANMTVWQL
jgi:hypothetical protein